MTKISFCPICKLEVKRTEPCFPFCCERCQTIDLGRWADGSYSIPGEAVSEHDVDDNSHAIH